MKNLFNRLIGAKTSEFPDWWKVYANSCTIGLPKNAPLETMRFVVFDTETTGLNPASDRILSIGAVAMQSFDIVISDNLECYVRQQYQPNGKEIEVHGILPVDHLHLLEEADAVRQFIEYAGNAVLVGHHIDFDLSMVNKALKRMNLPSLMNATLDTAQLAQRLKPPASGYATAGEYSLDKLCTQYGIPGNDRHTAAGDAFITALLLVKLLARLKQRGVITAGALLRK